jgi:hypothetical protein
MRILVVVTVATLAVGRHCIAQDVSVMAQAIPLVTSARPTATRLDLAEGYLTQPLVMAHASWAGFTGIATLNSEGLTLKRGELSTGGYGEGYVDRRHPHAYVHELLAGRDFFVGGQTNGGWSFSTFAGRGFVPFGSDDPMVRPFEKYPVNHHLSQVLERLVAIAAARYGPVIAELGTFNGDEPLGPGAPPDVSRFGDSWSTRLTVLPSSPLEISGSFADVRSPEVPTGRGLDQFKSNVYARYDRSSSAGRDYALAEWSRTSERDHDVTVTRLGSLLAEGSVCRFDVVVAGRWERTDRPEEETTLDPFRTPRPSADLSNLGVSRWTTLTGGLAAPRFPVPMLHVVGARPFVEVAYVTAARGDPGGLFDPVLRYGTSHMWMLSAGVRLRAGQMHGRMGRYGVAVPAAMAGMPMAGMPGMPGMPDMPHAQLNQQQAPNGQCEQ